MKRILACLIALFAVILVIYPRFNVSEAQTSCPFPDNGDANCDGKVDGIDFTIWLINYNQTTSNGASDGDFNGDDRVDGIDFTIWLNNYGTTSSAVLTLTTPNGGEEWNRGSTYEITWEQSEVANSTALFLYIRGDSGEDQYIGAIEYNVSNQLGTNSYSWTIPELGSSQTNPPADGDNIIIEVAQYDSNNERTYSDKSDSTFAVTTPQPTLISPNGGEEWNRGSTYEITWEQSMVAGSTSLFVYTRNSSGEDQYIGPIEYNVSNQLGTNSYSWTIPPLDSLTTTPPDGDNIIVEVAQYDSNGQRIARDKSDSTLTIITPRPTLTSPNGGEQWERGNTYEITWEQSYEASSTGLFIYTRDSNGEDQYIGPIEYNVSNQLGTNSYSWTIPPLDSQTTTPPDGDNIIVGVAQYDSNGQRITMDKSDNVFSINTPRPTLTSPNGGEQWERGSTYEITWEQSYVASSTGLFIYTRNSSGEDQYIGPIEYNVSNQLGSNSYTWTIPHLDSQTTTPPDGDNLIVGVAQYDSNGQRITMDKSDDVFTIQTPKPTLIDPNGGEDWERGRTYEVTWEQSMVAESTSLFVYTRSSSGEDRYIGPIKYNVSNQLGTNSYSWTIPPLDSQTTTPPDGDNIIVSVAQYDSSGLLITEDKSDNVFTIYSP